MLKGKRLVFVTNNSTKSREDYLAKFRNYGITVAKEEIVSSSSAMAHYLKNELHFNKKAYIIGMAAFSP